MASIRKRNNKWQVQVRRKGAGSIAKSFMTKSEATRWAYKQELNMERGLYGHIGPSDITLRDLLERYKSEVTPTKRGAAQEIRRINRLMRDPFTAKRVSELLPSALARFRDERLKCGARAAQYDLVIIGHCLKVAKLEWGLLLSENPVKSIRPISPNRPRERRLSEQEYASLKEASTSLRNPYIWPMVDFALATSMRRSEILRLTWGNVNMTNSTCFLPITKNGCSRTLVLSQEAKSILEALPKGGQRAFETSENAFRLSWARLKKRAGLDDLHFHDLRHEAISRLFEHGLTMPEVMAISGHKTPAMLFRYAHADLERIRKKIG